MNISVIMVSFNSQDTIGHAVDSFLAQDHADRTLLVVDGASRDRTCDIVRGYGSPLVTLVSERDKGIYDAMNKGLRLFTGEAFGFLNSDDRYHDARALSRISDALQDADLVTGNLDYVRAHGEGRPVRRWLAEPFRPGAFARGLTIPHPTTYARRAVYERVGAFDPSYRSAGDYDWMIRALELERFRHRTIPHTLVDMKVGGESTAGLRALVQNSRELLRARRTRLGSGLVDFALFGNLFRKLRQVRPRNVMGADIDSR